MTETAFPISLGMLAEWQRPRVNTYLSETRGHDYDNGQQQQSGDQNVLTLGDLWGANLMTGSLGMK